MNEHRVLPRLQFRTSHFHRYHERVRSLPPSVCGSFLKARFCRQGPDVYTKEKIQRISFIYENFRVLFSLSPEKMTLLVPGKCRKRNPERLTGSTYNFIISTSTSLGFEARTPLSLALRRVINLLPQFLRAVDSKRLH